MSIYSRAQLMQTAGGTLSINVRANRHRHRRPRSVTTGNGLKANATSELVAFSRTLSPTTVLTLNFNHPPRTSARPRSESVCAALKMQTECV